MLQSKFYFFSSNFKTFKNLKFYPNTNPNIRVSDPNIRDITLILGSNRLGSLIVGLIWFSDLQIKKKFVSKDT